MATATACSATGTADSGVRSTPDASLHHVLENKFYADLAGTTTTQQRVRTQGSLESSASTRSRAAFDTMRTLAPPVGRGWEWLTGRHVRLGGRARRAAGAARREAAGAVGRGGDYDLVIDPTNLWLTIHESIGHATELDRALGYEANYAGTSFATFDQLGTLQYGSPLMHVTGDRTAEHGLATVGWDDEGVAGQQWDIDQGRRAGRLPARPARWRG